jgi:hypothetical protein
MYNVAVLCCIMGLKMFHTVKIMLGQYFKTDVAIEQFCILPINVLNHFLWQNLFKTAEDVEKGENGFPLFFVLFSKWIWTKIFAFNDFCDFFKSAHFVSFKLDQISSQPSLEPKELRSYGIFWLFLVSEI